MSIYIVILTNLMSDCSLCQLVDALILGKWPEKPLVQSQHAVSCSGLCSIYVPTSNIHIKPPQQLLDIFTCLLYFKTNNYEMIWGKMLVLFNPKSFHNATKVVRIRSLLPSKPSISVNSWFTVCSRSSLPQQTGGCRHFTIITPLKMTEVVICIFAVWWSLFWAFFWTKWRFRAFCIIATLWIFHAFGPIGRTPTFFQFGNQKKEDLRFAPRFDLTRGPKESAPCPKPALRWRPTASISSMKMMQGAFLGWLGQLYELY